MTERAALAALVYEENEPIDALLAELRRVLEARGRRVGGIMQSPCEETIYALHIESGRQIDLMQKLGSCAEGCRLDTRPWPKRRGCWRKPSPPRRTCVMVGRFGRVEAEGGGYLAEIGAAAERGNP